MAYAILRVQKLKAAVAVHRSLKHAFRTQDTPNANPELTPSNTHIGAYSVAEGMQKFRDRLPEKFRKDAVQCIEYLVTASPDEMNGNGRQQQDAYFMDSLQWLRDKHGVENVIYAGIHRDEKTPHMYAYVVPRIGEKLNCRAFLGGAKALSEMQTDFAEKVGLHHGFERGIEGSKAKHQRVSQFYATLNKEVKTPEITPEDLKPREYAPQTISEKLGLMKRVEAPETVAERISQKVRESYAPLQEKAVAFDLEAKKAKDWERTARSIARQAKPLLNAMKNLDQEHQRKMLQLVQYGGEKMVQAHKEKQQKINQQKYKQKQSERKKDRDMEL